MEVGTLHTTSFNVIPPSLSNLFRSNEDGLDKLRLSIYTFLHIYWLALTAFSLLFIYYMLFGFAVGIAGGEGLVVQPSGTVDEQSDESAEQHLADRSERRSWGGRKQEDSMDSETAGDKTPTPQQHRDAWEVKDEGDEAEKPEGAEQHDEASEVTAPAQEE